jgi:hypothetical protein
LTAPAPPKLVASATGADFIAADATRLNWSVFGGQGSIAVLVKGTPNPMNLAMMQSSPVGLTASQGYVDWAEYTTRRGHSTSGGPAATRSEVARSLRDPRIVRLARMSFWDRRTHPLVELLL